MRILLLIDIQNDFCPGGELGIADGDSVVNVANALIASGKYDLIIASQDYHPGEHKSFAVNHFGKRIFEQIQLNGLTQTLWPIHCVENTIGAQFHPNLDLNGIDYIVKKGRNPDIDSYSAFYDNGHLQETELNSLIEHEIAKRGISKAAVEIDVMGLATDYCVKFTALDACGLNYKTGIIVDGCRAANLDPNDGYQALQELKDKGVILKSSRDLLINQSINLNSISCGLRGA